MLFKVFKFVSNFLHLKPEIVEKLKTNEIMMWIKNYCSTVFHWRILEVSLYENSAEEIEVLWMFLKRLKVNKIKSLDLKNIFETYLKKQILIWISVVKLWFLLQLNIEYGY